MAASTIIVTSLTEDQDRNLCEIKLSREEFDSAILALRTFEIMMVGSYIMPLARRIMEIIVFTNLSGMEEESQSLLMLAASLMVWDMCGIIVYPCHQRD